VGSNLSSPFYVQLLVCRGPDWPLLCEHHLFTPSELGGNLGSLWYSRLGGPSDPLSMLSCFFGVPLPCRFVIWRGVTLLKGLLEFLLIICIHSNRPLAVTTFPSHDDSHGSCDIYIYIYNYYSIAGYKITYFVATICLEAYRVICRRSSYNNLDVTCQICPHLSLYRVIIQI